MKDQSETTINQQIIEIYLFMYDLHFACGSVIIIVIVEIKIDDFLVLICFYEIHAYLLMKMVNEKN